MKTKFFMKDLFTYALNGFLIKLFAFIMIPIIVRNFSVPDYGAIDTMLVFIGFIDLIIGLGYDISMKKSILIDSNNDDKKDYIITIFLFLIIWGALFLGLVLIFRNQLSTLIFGTDQYIKLFTFGLISCYTSSLIGMFLTIARIEFKRMKFLVINVIKTLLEYALIILIVLFVKKDAYFYFLSIIAVDFVFLIVLIILNRNILKGKFNKKIFITTISFGTPAMMSGIGYWIFNMSDKIMISNITGGTYQTAIYGMIIKMLSIYTFLITSFKQAWIPRAFQLYKSDKNTFKEKLEKIQIYTLVVFSVIAIVNFSGLRLMLNVFATPEYLEGLKIAFPLIIAYIFYPLTNIASIGLYVTNNMKKLSIIVWIAAIINVIINMLLISKIGIMAASLSTMIAYIFIFVLYWKYSCSALAWKINWKKPLSIIALMIISVLSINFININNIYIDLIAKLVISIIYIVILLLFKLIDLTYLKTLVREIFSKEKNVERITNIK